MSRQSRKPQAEIERLREGSPTLDRAQDDTQDRVRTGDALGAARLAGLEARVVVRPTIVLGPPGPSGFRLDGSTLRGVSVPGAPPRSAPAPGDPEAFGLITLPPSLVEELVTGPLPEPDAPPASNYRGDHCQTVRLGPGAAAERPAWDGTLSQAKTIERELPVSEDAITWALPSVEDPMRRPLPPPPPSAAARTVVAAAPASARLGRTWRSPTFPPPELPQARAGFRPVWAWLLAGLALITMLLAYTLISHLLSHEPSPRLEPFIQATPPAQP